MEHTEEEMLGKENMWDELTGIYNRKGFYYYAEKLLKKYPETEFGLIYWNIQKFKVINDLFGWDNGNKILLHVAQSIKEEFSEEQSVYGRLGRDNFICCVKMEIIEKWDWLRLGTINYGEEDFTYEFFSCYGLYRIVSPEMPINTMVDKAKVAMETVRDNYIKPYAWYDDSMWDSLVAEQRLSTDFKAAIEERQFQVYYQPICGSGDGTVASAEALVRWQQPEKGMISPGSFIPLFEKNGLISVLDRYVWNEVCRMLRERIDMGKKVVPVSINVSRVEFYNKHLCKDILNIVESYSLPRELVRIEVTESAYTEDPRLVQRAVEQLHEYGFIVLMDDFGSGYSSLNTLKDMPIDVLKIDMKFMDGFEKNYKTVIILEAIIRMAKLINLKVVAEGVETKEEWDYLRSVECEFLQGFYFYRPMPGEDFETLLDGIGSTIFEKSGEEGTGNIDEHIMDIFKYGMSMESRLFYNMTGGMGICEATEEDVEILQVNQGYYEEVYGSEQAKWEGHKVVNEKVEEPAKSILLEKCKEAREKQKVVRLQMHYKRKSGGYVWLSVKLRYIGKKGKRSLFYFTVDNIDDIKKEKCEQ